MTPPDWTVLTSGPPRGTCPQALECTLCCSAAGLSAHALGEPLIMLETQGPREEQKLLGWALSSSHTIHHVLTLGWMATQGVRTPTWTRRSSTQSADVGGLRERREQALDALQEAARDCVQRGG